MKSGGYALSILHAFSKLELQVYSVKINSIDGNAEFIKS